MANIIEIADKFPLSHKMVKVGKIPVEIKTYLDVDAFATAANTIANSCFDGETGEYRPEYYEIAKRYVVLQYLTDIELDDVSVEEVFKIAQNDWYYDIEKACAVLIYLIEDAAAKIIEYRRKTAFDNLCDNVSAILKQDNEQNLADIKEVLTKLDKVDKEAFVEAVVDNNIAKNRGGEDDGEKSEGATE